MTFNNFVVWLLVIFFVWLLGCKKLNDGILQAAEVNFASGRRTVVSCARAVNGACIVNGAEKKII